MLDLATLNKKKKNNVINDTRFYSFYFIVLKTMASRNFVYTKCIAYCKNVTVLKD